MGTDYSGGMLVGAHGTYVSDTLQGLADNGEYEGGVYGLVEELGLEVFAEYYDAHLECSYIGFPVDTITVSSMNQKWLKDIQLLAEEFKELTGVDASLIGAQNIY